MEGIKGKEFCFGFKNFTLKLFKVNAKSFFYHKNRKRMRKQTIQKNKKEEILIGQCFCELLKNFAAFLSFVAFAVIIYIKQVHC